MRVLFLLLCVGCGQVSGSSLVPRENKKTCEYMVSGICVNTNGHEVKDDLVQVTLDVLLPLFEEEFHSVDMGLFEDKNLSVNFVSEDEIGYFCTTSNKGCYLSPENTIYVVVYEIVEPEFVSGYVWPGGVLGHELLHFLYEYTFENYDWKKNISHDIPGMFGRDSVESKFHSELYTVAYQKGEEI